jgi:hypothetical protein
MLHITKLFPKGDIPEPNNTLQVQWFYMSFHCSDRAEYVRSRRKLNNETLQTLAEYFESIFLAQFGSGLIQWKHDNQLHAATKRELCRELEECYRHKLKKLAASRDHYSSSEYQGKRVSKPIFLAFVVAPKLATPATGTPIRIARIARIARLPPRMVSSRSRAIYMAVTASIPTTSAGRTQETKYATTTTTTLKNEPMTCITMTATTPVAKTSCSPPVQAPCIATTN